MLLLFVLFIAYFLYFTLLLLVYFLIPFFYTNVVALFFLFVNQAHYLLLNVVVVEYFKNKISIFLTCSLNRGLMSNKPARIWRLPLLFFIYLLSLLWKSIQKNCICQFVIFFNKCKFNFCINCICMLTTNNDGLLDFIIYSLFDCENSR